MRQNLRLIARLSRVIGFEPKHLVDNLRALPVFGRSFKQYNRTNRRPTLRGALRDIYPILGDTGKAAGVVGGHYFHQDLWAARKVFERRPKFHLDIGSRVDGFIAHLLVFMPVTLVDVRPIRKAVPGLTFMQQDATNLDELADQSIESLSSLHAAEHFGLGRYGDAIDPDACFRFMETLQRVLAPAGRLYFSVPIGRERVEFNAHRVFGTETILNSFAALQLRSFSFVGDDGELYENVNPADVPGSDFACGLFEFTKAAGAA